MKINIIKNLPVKWKIFSLIGMIFTFIGIFILFQFLELSSLNKEIDANHIKQKMMQAKRNEMHFLDTRDLKYAEQTNTAIDKLDSIIAPYKHEELSKNLIEKVAEYSNIFNKTIKLVEKRGLNEEKGLEGKLRVSVHRVEGILDKVNNQTILIDMLMCRRHEKDYFLRHEKKYIDELKESVSLLKNHTQKSNLSLSTKEQIKILIDNYENDFLAASGIINDINQNAESLNKVDSEANLLIAEIINRRQSAEDFSSRLKYIILFISIAASLFIAFSISKDITNSLKQLIDTAKEIIAGNFSNRLNLTSKDEFGTLGKTFNIMMEKISTQVQYLNNVPNSIMVIDKEFNIQFINKAGAEAIGKDQKQLIGQKCYDQFKTEHCQTDKCASYKAMQSGNTNTEETVAHPQGIELPILYTGAAIKDNDSNIIGAMEVIASIKDIKENQNYLTRSTKNLLLAMDKFAEGDLMVSVVPEKQDDDIGRLFNGFNKSIVKIKDIINKVIQVVKATASATNEISSSTEEMAAGAQEQSQQATEIASAVEQMTQTILETTRNANSAANSAKEAGSIANEGGKVVEETISGMNKIAEVVRKSAKTVKELGKGSDQIGEIVQVIDDIADQTNLLALNAAIEAARAGEQGRGFAVVADEVRKLAERTTKATKEIADMIKKIQKDTGEAVVSMNEGTEEVENGIQLADKAGQSLKDIITGSNKVVDVASQVAAASEEQSSASEQISKNIESIANVTNQSAAGIQQVARASEDLNKLTENLQKLISQFKVSNTDGLKSQTITGSNNGKHDSNAYVRKNGKLIYD